MNDTRNTCQYQNRKNITLFKRHLTTFFCFFFFLPLTAQIVYGEKFPIYPVIKKNINFWESVYGTYTSQQGIFHDREDLGIVYGVVNLVDRKTPGAARINKKLIQISREQYKKILFNLAHKKKPHNREGQRVAALFKGAGKSRFLRARENIRLQIGQKDRFREGFIRSGAYLPQFKAIFRTHGLPLPLVYLPHVESSFNAGAHSKAGAVGMWQFMPATGKEFMTVNELVDERRDPFISANGAAKLLKQNYNRLGTWPLALTAYNYGRAGMVRAVARHKNYENTFKYNNKGRFGFAARNFYSKFIASYLVTKRLEKDPTIIQNRPEATITIRMRKYGDTEEIRRWFRLSAADFSRLNKALRKPVLNGEKHIPRGYLLRVPATTFTRQQAKNFAPRLYHHRQIRDKVYTVKRGDTLGSIARRYKIPAGTIATANNLNKKGTIRIGQKLTILGMSNRQTVITLNDTSKRKP
jgi:membrane-bound lytic murein transglycosylase D